MRKGWEYKKLGEVATYINGYAFKPDQWKESGTPIVRIQNLNNANAPYNYYDGEVPDKVKIQNGDLLISWSASLGAYIWNGGKAFLNQHIFKVAFDKTDIDKFFLKYAVTSKLAAMAEQVHGATMKHIVKKDFDNTLISYPPLSTQISIVSELDKINELIRLKKEQLKDFDNLAQSLFYEMFGDPVENEKGWEVKKLGDVCIYPNKRIQVTELNPQDYVGVENLQKNRAGIVFSDKIPNTDSAIAFSPNDILIGNIRPYLKKIWLADKNGGASGDVVIIRICTNDLLPMYLYKVLASDQFFEYDNTYTKGAKMPRGDRKAIAKFMVPLPPLSLQHLFAQRIEQIEREKSEVQKSIQDLETLLASRMQYWFE